MSGGNYDNQTRNCTQFYWSSSFKVKDYSFEISYFHLLYRYLPIFYEIRKKKTDTTFFFAIPGITENLSVQGMVKIHDSPIYE